MKIKITLIAFFATALMFTSCVKNEVSPGIEDVRSAYAELLSAKAQAEIIAANAEANFTNAEAAVQTAMAAVQQANAAAIAATSADQSAAAAQALVLAQANLANQMEWWARAIAADDLAIAQALAAYEALLVEAANDMALDYFGSYVDALDELRAVQGAIFAKQAMITALELDIVNGTTNGYDAIVEDLASANAGLDFILAEYETAKTFLGDVDAVMARINELAALLTANEKAQLDNTAAQIELDLDLSVELAAIAAAEAAVLAAEGDVAAAEGVVAAAAAALADPEAAFYGDYPAEGITPPEFWQDALDAVAAAQLAVDTYDTTTTYNLWNDVVVLIEEGTDALEADIADYEAEIETANMTIDEAQVVYDGLVADTVVTYDALVAAEAAEAATQSDIDDLQDDLDDWADEILVLNDLVAAHNDTIGVVEGDGDAPGGDGILSTTSEADHIIIRDGYLDDIGLLNAYIFIGNNTMIGLNSQLVLDQAEVLTAIDAHSGVGGSQELEAAGLVVLDGVIAAQDAIILGLEADIANVEDVLIPAQEALIAAAEAALPDLYSDHLHALSFYDELQLALADALAAKEAVRPDYEEYMDAFFYDYVAGLEAALVDAEAALADAEAALATEEAGLAGANAAYVLARTPLTDLEDAMDDLNDEWTLLDNLLGAYGDINDYNADYLADLETMIADQVDAIAVLEDDLAAAEEAYTTGIVDYDKYMQDLEVLDAELAAAQGYVAYWKALLDAALATS